MVLQKLTEVAGSWADFYIKDVLSRDNRAENFKVSEKLIKSLKHTSSEPAREPATFH
jgi:hypothetical protein